MQVKGSGSRLSTFPGFALVILVATSLISPSSSSKHATFAPTGSNDRYNEATNETDNLSSTNNTSTTTPSAPKLLTPKDYRLPTSVLPINYEVEIQLYMNGSDPSNFKFKGHVKIQMRCANATNNIILHVDVLKVETNTIRFSGESRTWSVPEIIETKGDKERQFFIIKLNRNMEAGETYTLEMNYTSPLQQKDLNGLYLSHYGANDQRVYLAVTQFEPVYARKAFPCFDEPSFKATFDITIIRPDHLISLSNMPQKDNTTKITEDGVTYVKDVYQRTPKMSTYLVAFAVCDYIYISRTNKNGVLFRAWTSPEFVNYTRYKLDETVETLYYFENFLNISYSLPKQDIFAIPHMTHGGMENWGLTTYREATMLFKEGSSIEDAKETISAVASHENAHEWFGNLVTPAWWDDLWLKEGFTSFFEVLAVDYAHPDWKMLDKFGLFHIRRSMPQDGMLNSHPLNVPVSLPYEISGLYDIITYYKGAALVRMLRHFLGYETFQKGMIKYLKRYAYDAACDDDLWGVLSEQAREDGKNIQVKAIMDTWTLQMNFPLVTVTRLFSAPDTVVVSQERYLADRNQIDPGKYVSPFNYTWTIPLTFATRRNPYFNQTDQDVQWLSKFERSKTFTLGGAGHSQMDNTTNNALDPNRAETDWIIANVEHNGYYRVNYQLSNWKALANQLKDDHLVIPVINRAQIIYDVWSLAKDIYLGLDTAFMMIDYLHKELEFAPWFVAANEMSYAIKMFSNSRINETFQKFMQSKLNEPYRYIGLNNTGASHNDVATRRVLAHWACRFNIQACHEAALTQFRQWMHNRVYNPIDLNFKKIIYCSGIATGGDAEWNFALEMYRTLGSSTEKSDLLNALSCSKNPETIKNFMELILTPDSPILPSDALNVINLIAQKTDGALLAWDFFRRNFTDIKAIFGEDSTWSLMQKMTVDLNEPSELEQVKAFCNEQAGNLTSGRRACQSTITRTMTNIDWMTIHEPVIENWLRAAGYHQA